MLDLLGLVSILQSSRIKAIPMLPSFNRLVLLFYPEGWGKPYTYAAASGNFYSTRKKTVCNEMLTLV